MRCRSLLGAAVMLAGVSATLPAQYAEIARLAQDRSTVRLATSGSPRFTGRLVSFRADTLFVSTDAALRRIHLSELRTLDERHQSRAAGAARGGLAGLLVVGGFTSVIAAVGSSSCKGQEMCGIIWMVPMVAAPAGLVIGSLIGTLHPRDVWSRVSFSKAER